MNSLNVRGNRFFGQFFGEISFIKSKFSSVSIKILKVEMDSATLNFIGAPKLSKFMDFQKFEFLPDSIENK